MIGQGGRPYAGALQPAVGPMVVMHAVYSVPLLLLMRCLPGTAYLAFFCAAHATLGALASVLSLVCLEVCYTMYC
jgi:hypothetical protein